MWLGLFFGIVIVIALILAIFAGGAFTIIVLPAAVFVALVALAFSGWGRASARKADEHVPPQGEGPVPAASQHANTVAAPTTPDQLADARRAQQ
ncbi:MAG: hypothetical protein ACRDMX_00280 [Solirubrobacteraceae bacterium]